MEGAFVVRLKSEDEPEPDELAGSVEEVDTGLEIRFHSTDELVKFLRQHRPAGAHSESEPGRRRSKASDHHEHLRH